jgi:signal transduction histidine kinase
MQLQSRINAGLLAIAVILVTPLVLALRALHGLQMETRALRDREYAATLLLGRMRTVQDDLAQSAALLTLFPSDTTRELFLGYLATLAAQGDTLERLATLGMAPRLRASLARLREQGPRAYELARSGRSAAADSIADLVLRPALGDLRRFVQNAELALEARTTEKVQDFADRTAEASLVGVGALGIAALLAFALAMWLSRSITTPLRELDNGMRAVAQGRFGHPLAISPERSDEFGRLAASYRTMAAQLSELGRLRAEFLSVASHELKTPVNVLLGYLQLLQENAYGELTAKQREILETMTSQTQLLARLVRQLLDVSRFDAGGGRLDVRPVVLEDFFHELERAFRVLALQREVRFDVQVARDLPHEVQWDPERMNEVIGNLLSNAFKFTPKGGRVSLSACRQAEWIELQVADTGSGIPEEQLPHIFEKFYQGSPTEGGSRLHGAGLGLAIAKSIVTAHGGSIAVESRVGQGTVFTIRLPVRVQQSVLRPADRGQVAI